MLLVGELVMFGGAWEVDEGDQEGVRRDVLQRHQRFSRIIRVNTWTEKI